MTSIKIPVIDVSVIVLFITSITVTPKVTSHTLSVVCFIETLPQI